MIEHGSLNVLGEILVAKIKDSNLKFDMIFGPAYKGIFLGSILATKLSEKECMPICFNRKEVKEHGEGGSLLGALPKGNVLIIDDVVSSGLAIREAVTFLRNYDVNVDLLDADEIIDESVLQSIRNYRDKFRGENV